MRCGFSILLLGLPVEPAKKKKKASAFVSAFEIDVEIIRWGESGEMGN